MGIKIDWRGRSARVAMTSVAAVVLGIGIGGGLAAAARSHDHVTQFNPAAQTGGSASAPASPSATATRITVPGGETQQAPASQTVTIHTGRAAVQQDDTAPGTDPTTDAPTDPGSTGDQSGPPVRPVPMDPSSAYTGHDSPEPPPVLVTPTTTTP